MSDKDISKMDFKELRSEVQLLRDELSKAIRKYEDILYNIDTDNFSGRLVREQNEMKSEISITSEEIKTKVSETDLAGTLIGYSTISQTATQILQAVNTERTFVTDLLGEEYYTKEEVMSQITTSVEGIQLEVLTRYETKDSADDKYAELISSIDVERDRITAFVNGDAVGEAIEAYFTGIEISPGSIKMINGTSYGEFAKEGLRFFDSEGQREGWSIEPSDAFGGELVYHVNDGRNFIVGRGQMPLSGSDYTWTDMVFKAYGGSIGRFVVDLTSSGSREVKFVGLGASLNDDNKPLIYANEKLLATQSWVKDYLTAEPWVAVFA